MNHLQVKGFPLVSLLARHSAKISIGFALLAISLTTASCSKQETDAGASAPPAVPVKIQTLTSSNVQDSSEFVGSLEADQRAVLRPEIQGRIKQVIVNSGDRVSSGTPLMLLEPDQVVPQVQGAQAQVSIAQANRDAALQQLKVAQSNRATATSDMELKKVNYERARYLIGQGAIAQLQVDQAQQQYITAQNTLKAANNQVQAAQAAVEQAEAGIKQARAQVSSANVNLGLKQITAPIAGVMGDVPVKLGDYVTVGQAIGTIIKNDFFDLRISIPANRSAQLRQGLPVQLIDPDTQKVLSTGKINFIAPGADSNTQSVLTKAQFANSNGNLRDGQYVQARVIWKQQPGMLIPTSAVTRTGTQNFVFVAESDTEKGQVARQRPVKLGAIQGSSYQVVSGVKPGENVITSNILRLRDGTSIQAGS